MSWVAVAVVAAGAIAGGAAVYSANTSADAQQAAADEQAAAAGNATQVQWNQFKKEQENLQPFQQSEAGALGRLNQAFGSHANYDAPIAQYGGASAREILEMAVGNKPNPNGYTVADAQKASRFAPTVYGELAQAPTFNKPGGATPQFNFNASSPKFNFDNKFNFDPNSVTMDPGYAFRKQQGVDAITAAGAAAGNLGSGKLGTDLVSFGQNLASQEYQNAFARQYGMATDDFTRRYGISTDDYNRQLGEFARQYGMSTDAYNRAVSDFNRQYGISVDDYNRAVTAQSTKFNQLASMANPQGTQMINQAGQTAASNVANIAIGQGNNQASATVGSANAWAAGVGGVANSLSSGITNYQNQQQQNRLMTMVDAGNNGMAYNPSTNSYVYQNPAAVGPPATAAPAGVMVTGNTNGLNYAV